MVALDSVQSFDPDQCFLCGEGIPPKSAKRTREHVFPRWLLEKLSLYDRGITSLNGRTIHYRKLVVPCCTGCNSGELARVEHRVKTAIESGPDWFRTLDRRDAFLWLGKIYYGLLYFESLQPRDPRSPHGPTVVQHGHLQTLQFHHLLLQAARGKVNWQPETPGPASILTFECLPSTTVAGSFDYADDLDLPILALRIGTMGIITVLQDWGHAESVGERRLLAGSRMAIHPTQFRELFALVRYLSHATWTDRKHITLTDPTSGTTTIIAPQSVALAIGAIDPSIYAEFLATALETSIAEVFDGHRVIMLSCDETDEPTQVSADTAFVGLSGAPLWPFHGELS